MAALIVGGHTVLKITGARMQPAEAIDASRSQDNTLLVTLLGDAKDEYTIDIGNYTRAELTALESALAATPPLSCSGDILGATMSMQPSAVRFDVLPGTSPLLFSGSFTLQQV